MLKSEDVKGKQFGRLTATGKIEYRSKSDGTKTPFIECICSCGKLHFTNYYSAKRGDAKSCGCFQQEIRETMHITHNGSKTRLYRIWKNLFRRCYKVNCREYKWYGAKGVTVCEEWLKDFATFRDWAMSHGYSDDLTLDRIDHCGNYEPENCRWADWITQQNNRSSNRFYTHNGKTQTIAQWAHEYNIPECNLITRMNKGWDFETALTKPKIDSVTAMEGAKYNHLTVLKRVPKPQHIKSRGAYYLCKCDCGNEKIIVGQSLRNGNTKSCGCELGRKGVVGCS